MDIKTRERQTPRTERQRESKILKKVKLEERQKAAEEKIHRNAS